MSEILAITEDWSFWQRPAPVTVPRRVSLPRALRPSLALVILGVRRCGKSTLMRQLLDRYQLPPARCFFLNLEDPRLARQLHFPTLQALRDAARARYPTGPLWFFLDEIQEVEGWQRWLRARLDLPGDDHFILTGSNASLLSGELASVLTGRHLSVTLSPFDLTEARSLRPGLSLHDYLILGGFPEPLAMEDGDLLRRQYLRDIVERDVRERVRARSSLPLRQLVQMAYESAGSELSVRRIAASIGVSADTASLYLGACEQAYLLSRCQWFAYSERRRAARNAKLYPVDTGLRRVAVTRTGRDLGKALECAAYNALRRAHDQVYYWRDGGEVDFVVRDGAEVTPIQVSWEGPQERHHRALDLFYERFPHAQEARFITQHNAEALLGG